MLLAGGPQAGQHGGDALSPQCNWSGLSPSRGPAGASDAHDTKLLHSVAASSPLIGRNAKLAYGSLTTASHCSRHVLSRPPSPDVASPRSNTIFAPVRAPGRAASATRPRAAGAARAVRRQRDRGARLRGRLVPAA